MRRNMTAIALAALTALAVPAAADAQDPQTERPRVGQRSPGPQVRDPAARILALRQEIGLTDAQVTRIEQIRAALQERNAPLLAQLVSAREAMPERRELTPEQREQMRARMQERRAAMRERRERGDTIRERTDSARAAMRERRAAEGERVRDRTGVPGELQPVMEQLQSNTREAMEQIRSVLTDAQHQKLRELRPEAVERREAMQRRRGSERGLRPGAGHDRSR